MESDDLTILGIRAVQGLSLAAALAACGIEGPPEPPAPPEATAQNTAGPTVTVGVSGSVGVAGRVR